MRIYDIESPAQIKNLSMSELNELAEDIRYFLLHSISKTGGHLSSNLGIVELTIALHVVFDAPEDKIIYDLGHQSYVHKILTGRSTQFANLRKYHGLSGYQKREESVYDCWEANHSSTSLSAALGFALARDIQKKEYEVIAVIGDIALHGGQALEALQDIGKKRKKVIIIYNDNNQDKNKKSTIEKGLNSIRTSNVYQSMKSGMKSNLASNRMGKGVLHTMGAVKDHIKENIVDAPLFQAFDVDYLGPIDGHDIKALVSAFEMAKKHEGPIVVHVLTQKGKGYTPAETDPDRKWHEVAPFDLATGQSLIHLPANQLSWSAIMIKTLTRLAGKDPNIALVGSIIERSEIGSFQKEFPDKTIDYGIYADHAITMAAGMAQAGLHPLVSLHAAALQTVYDAINHDLGAMDLPVVLGIDGAGLAGNGSEIHHGIYDISLLRTIPNMIVAEPKDDQEAQDLLYTAFQVQHPFALRYPLATTVYHQKDALDMIQVGSWSKFEIGEDPACIVITYGPDVDRVINKAKENGYSLIVTNARFLKPIDMEMIQYIYHSRMPVYIYESDIKIGGLSSAILEAFNQIDPKIDILGIDDHIVGQGPLRTLRMHEHISIEDLFKAIDAHG